MRLDIVTPEKLLVSTDVTSVQIPGMEGDMTIMENHAATVTTLRPGVVTVTGGEGGEFVVIGGFAEVSADGASILAEKAVTKADANAEMLQEALAAAEAAVDTAAEDDKTAARQRVNDLSDLLKQIG